MLVKAKIYILSGIVLLFATCKKSDTTSPSGIHGNASLTVKVMHHSWGVPSIPVYLKFNTSDWPGKDSSQYDVKQQANREGVVTFSQLGPGNIVVYAAGFDSIFWAPVKGYTSVTITRNDANATVNATVIASE